MYESFKATVPWTHNNLPQIITTVISESYHGDDRTLNVHEHKLFIADKKTLIDHPRRRLIYNHVSELSATGLLSIHVHVDEPETLLSCDQLECTLSTTTLVQELLCRHRRCLLGRAKRFLLQQSNLH